MPAMRRELPSPARRAWESVCKSFLVIVPHVILRNMLPWPAPAAPAVHIHADCAAGTAKNFLRNRHGDVNRGPWSGPREHIAQYNMGMTVHLHRHSMPCVRERVILFDRGYGAGGLTVRILAR